MRIFKILFIFLLNSFSSAKAAEQGLVSATMDASLSKVRYLVKQGANLEETDYKQQTALIIACVTDQFEVAEFLIDSGANVFAASTFGWTAGYATETSKLVRGPEAKARARVIQKLKDKGVPSPAPRPAEVKKMLADGSWPPQPKK